MHFLKKEALGALITEAKTNQVKAFYSSSTHNIYLTPSFAKVTFEFLALCTGKVFFGLGTKESSGREPFIAGGKLRNATLRRLLFDGGRPAGPSDELRAPVL